MHLPLKRLGALLAHPLPWVLLGLFIRLAYLTEQQATSVLFYQPLLDEQEMVGAARQLLAGGGFGAEPLFKAPLYPVYLAGIMRVFGEGWFYGARLIQHLLGALLILLAYYTARRCFSGPAGRGRVAGACAAGALALYGPLIRLEGTLILDFMTVFLQSALVWALVRLRTTSRPANEPHWAALAGFVALLAWLTRPTLTPLLPFLALWIVGLPLLKPRLHRRMLKRRLACAALFLALPLLGMVGIYWRNAAVGGEGMLLPWQGGFNVYHANSAKANGRYFIQDQYSLSQRGNPTRELAEAGYRQAVARGDVSPAPPGGFYHAIDHYWTARAKTEILQNPARWLGLITKKAIYLTSDREIFNFEDYEVQKALSRILRLLPPSFGWLWPLALLSVAFVGRIPHIRRDLVVLMWLYALVLGAAIALYYVSGRLRMPLVFPVAVLAATGVAGLRTRLSRPQAILAAVLFLIGATLSWGDWWGVRFENVRPIEYARLSNAAWHGNQFDKALSFAQACEREQPGYPTAALLRGQALYGLNRIPEAASAFEDSVRRLPQDPVAPFNLGIIQYYHRRDPRRALAMFEEARRRQPTYHAAAWMGALACLGDNRRDQARRLMQPYLPVRTTNPPTRLLIAAAAFYTADHDPDTARAVIGRLKQQGGDRALSNLAEEFCLLNLALP